MSDEPLEDLSDLFTRLQGELEPAGIGGKCSLEAQLKAVEADLHPLFLNPDRLSAGLGTGGLTYEHAFLMRTQEWSHPRLLRLLEEYRTAQATDAPAVFKELSEFFPHMDRAYRHVVSIAELEADKAELKEDAFARSCLRDMGDLIEATLKPFLRLRLRVLEIGRMHAGRASGTSDLSLGGLISELESIDPGLYTPAPFGITLSQWRNISHHSSYWAANGMILCEYGRPDRLKTLRCSPEKLIDLFIEVEKIYYLHKVAFEFFSTDNILALSSAEADTGAEVTLSELSKQAILAYGIVASGFRILKVARREFRWGLFLNDRHNRDEERIGAALQSCIVPYLLHAGPTQINAWVQSQGEQSFISFKGELRHSSSPEDDKASLFRMDRNFRVREADSS